MERGLALASGSSALSGAHGTPLSHLAVHAIITQSPGQPDPAMLLGLGHPCSQQGPCRNGGWCAVSLSGMRTWQGICVYGPELGFHGISR